MKDPWPEVPLADIAEPISRPVAVVPGQDYRTIGVKWWGEGAYERETIDGSRTAAKTLSLVRQGDLIINKIWVRHGSTAIAGTDVDGCAASGEFPTFELNRERVVPEWIHWQTKTPAFWSKCDALSRGTSGKNRIKPELFVTIRVPLPPFAEQRHVLGRIEELAAQIDEARTLRREAAEALENLFASKLRAVVEECKDKTTKLPFTEITKLERRPVVVELDKQYGEIGVYCFGKGIFHKPPRSGADLGGKDLYEIREGDFILQITFAWEGAVALAGKDDSGLFGSVRYLTFRVKEDICSPRYLLTYMKTPGAIAELARISPGSAGRNRVLSVRRLNEVLVPVVPLEAQKWLNDQLQAEVNALKSLQSETAAELDALLPSILDKAFKGEL
jgi:type I restriction enzyme, S subunit